MAGGQFAQGTSRCPVCRLAGHPRLCSLRHRQQFGTTWPKTELAVKPECARLDGLLVLVAELVRVNGEASHICELMQKVKHLGVDPGGFAVAERVESVKSDFHPLEQ